MVRLRLKVSEVLDVPSDATGLDTVELYDTRYTVQGDTMFVTRLWRIPQIQQPKKGFFDGVKLLKVGQ